MTWTVWQKGEPILTVVMLRGGVSSSHCPPIGLGKVGDPTWRYGRKS